LTQFATKKEQPKVYPFYKYQKNCVAQFLGKRIPKKCPFPISPKIDMTTRCDQRHFVRTPMVDSHCKFNTPSCLTSTLNAPRRNRLPNFGKLFPLNFPWNMFSINVTRSGYQEAHKSRKNPKSIEAITWCKAPNIPNFPLSIGKRDLVVASCAHHQCVRALMLNISYMFCTIKIHKAPLKIKISQRACFLGAFCHVITHPFLYW